MDQTSGGYTSGAINSDEDPGNLNFCLDTEGQATETLSPPATTSLQKMTALGSQMSVPSPCSGSMYSPGDYQSLSAFLHRHQLTPSPRSRPRKKTPIYWQARKGDEGGVF